MPAPSWASTPSKTTSRSERDPDNGREVAVNRKKGNCLACHVMPIPEQSFHGEIGPDLNGVASRYDAGELRLRLVDPKVVNPGTIMPSLVTRARMSGDSVVLESLSKGSRGVLAKADTSGRKKYWLGPCVITVYHCP